MTNPKTRYYPVHPTDIPVDPARLNQHQRLAFDGINDLNFAIQHLKMNYLTVSGVQNNSNKVFTIPTAPKTLLFFYKNGLLLSPGGVDYTLIGNQISLLVAPAPADRLLAIGA